jgi:nickel transport protein
LHFDPVKKPLLLFVVLIAAQAASAHGARVDWDIRETGIHLQAAFDDGAPMDSAQVTVYSQSDPAVPYLTSFTDGNGEYIFQPGDVEDGWDIQVRKAGHGAMIHVPPNPQNGQLHTGGFSTLQTIVMAACVVWGFTGTALFFRSRRKVTNAHS